MAKVKILVDAPFYNFDPTSKPGAVRDYKAGDEVDFPEWYIKRLSPGLVELIEEGLLKKIEVTQSKEEKSAEEEPTTNEELPSFTLRDDNPSHPVRGGRRKRG